MVPVATGPTAVSPVTADAFVSLGEFLTGSEAAALAAQLELGMPMFRALDAIDPTRRRDVKRLIEAVGVTSDPSAALAALHAIAGAKSVLSTLTPVWTMPGNEATEGYLTSEFHRLVSAARLSVTCATYNFEPTSQMWDSLRVASSQSGIVTTVYVDRSTADAAKIKAQLPRATVYQSAVTASGKPITSHAKFVIVDHRLVLLTSANFSYSAENRNIELGILVDNPTLAASLERTMLSKHGTLYELVEVSER
jgi:phosphatidylserine/phosphatidylglycerophosphate/cardiolipin synthase-like enzyme